MYRSPVAEPRGPLSATAQDHIPAPCTTSLELLRGGRELQIVHGDALYRLRLTAQGKLILTK